MRRLLLAIALASACASTQSQINALPAEQRSYFDQIHASGTEDDGHALETARASRALTDDDRRAVREAEAALAAAPVRKLDDDLVQLEIAFDGTWDDREKMTVPTNPALLDELFDGPKHYEAGVGTSAATKYIGGAFGAGLHHRIDRAYEWLVEKMNSRPGAQFALVITGFSRGATTARAFVNVLNHRGVPDYTSPGARMPGPRIAAMILFDTVGSVGVPGTNLNPGLDLSIPANAENVLHLTARDEKRLMFPLSSARDPAAPGDARIVELALPGAHGDVGGGHPNRYTRIALAMAYAYMQRAGIHLAPLADVPDLADPALRLHDSGGRGPRHVFASKNPPAIEAR